MLCSVVAGRTSAYRTALELGAERVARSPARRRVADRDASSTPADDGLGAGRLVGVARRLGRRRRDHVRVCPRPGRGPVAAPRSSSTPTPSGPGSTGCSGSTRPTGCGGPTSRPRPDDWARGRSARRCPRAGRLARADLVRRRARPPCRATSCATACPPPAAATTWSSSTCPRGADPLVDELVARCDLVVVVVSPTVCGVASTTGPGGPVRASTGTGAGGARHGARPRRASPR